ncbi:VOC family protein [Streptomyces sp. NPDC055105]|uniref:VOC family protein n=1 Tax=Streptomyces sp. NPDC055105 TaxID=3365719 RepID=UPI0037D22793
MAIKITNLNHVGIRVLDLERATRFYVDVLGLTPRPEKPNWLSAGDSYCIHLMPTTGGTEPIDVSRHVAFEVPDIRETAAQILATGRQPYQTDLEHNRHTVTSTDDPLDFGIATLFIEDPEGNTLEFVQFGHGWLFTSPAVHSANSDEAPTP